jgi:hypothetical protein
VRYLLLVINRETLLPGLVANGALWSGAIVSVAAIIAVIFAGVVLTRWLIARRAGVFAHQGRDETRSARALWAGCLVPVANLFWAPVFLIELAKAEGLHSRLRQQITVWWVLWALSTVAAVFATATSFTTDAQGIADNTVTVTLTYLIALATVIALLRVYDGFVRKPVDRPAHRWIVVGGEQPAPAVDAATAVEWPGSTPAPAEAKPAESEPPSAVEPLTEGDEEAVAAAPAGRGLAG